ncbi:MAG: phage virion morphogenesis protein [Desulfovibrionaceae bacterium]|jgi:phage virion morphogenesis protein|nr:phage virion morphogenesis protein [Desulfovibrionaceae bacterium]
MPARLQSLETWAAALMDRIGPAGCRQLALQIARELRTRNMRRMRAQQDPDGAPWQPRKSSSGRRRKSVKTAPMMRGLATAKWLRTAATQSAATVSFAGRAQRIARIHHFGERAAVNFPRGPMYDYPARELLGLADDDLERIGDMVLARVSGR